MRVTRDDVMYRLYIYNISYIERSDADDVDDATVYVDSIYPVYFARSL